MTILRPFLNPTVGVPQPVVASRRPRNMTEKMFFQQQMQQQPQVQMQQSDMVQAFQSAQQTRERPVQPEFEQAPVSGDYIQEQLQRYRQSSAPPTLEPGARVKSANAELVQPSNFEVYYQQLQAIDQYGQEMLGAETARAAYKRAQMLEQIQNFNGMPVGYKNPSGGKSLKKQNSQFGSAGSGIGTPLSGNREQARKIMQSMAQQWGWSGSEWDALVRLIMKESGFNPSAANPTSSARGLFQKMVSIHGPLENTIEGQILWGFNYIKRRYGSPSAALRFHLSHNWY